MFGWLVALALVPSPCLAGQPIEVGLQSGAGARAVEVVLEELRAAGHLGEVVVVANPAPHQLQRKPRRLQGLESLDGRVECLKPRKRKDRRIDGYELRGAVFLPPLWANKAQIILILSSKKRNHKQPWLALPLFLKRSISFCTSVLVAMKRQFDSALPPAEAVLLISAGKNEGALQQRHGDRQGHTHTHKHTTQRTRTHSNRTRTKTQTKTNCKPHHKQKHRQEHKHKYNTHAHTHTRTRTTHTHKHTNTQTHKHTNKHTHTHTKKKKKNTHTHTHTHAHTHTHTHTHTFLLGGFGHTKTPGRNRCKKYMPSLLPVKTTNRPTCYSPLPLTGKEK